MEMHVQIHKCYGSMHKNIRVFVPCRGRMYADNLLAKCDLLAHILSWAESKCLPQLLLLKCQALSRVHVYVVVLLSRL
jgi:hypothetical protein